jgi:hypothetical protein
MQKFYKWILSLLLIMTISGCHKDEMTDSTTNNNSVNKWIYSEMKSNYLWLDELKNFLRMMFH